MLTDFIKNALPFVIIGVCLAIILTHYSKQKKGRAEKTYLTEGMLMGISLGVISSISFRVNLALGISFGMLIGETIGILMKRKEENDSR